MLARFAMRGALRATVRRYQSTQAVNTLASVFEEYREKNYAQTLPSRFAKEVVGAADANGDGFLTKEEIATIFENIGATEAMSSDEINEAVNTLAGADGELSTAEFIDLLTGKK
ncbi:hypothetical protein TrCOL_g8902 [Triparma columacea]|uniref:EF-hand domain-containing protein n=1 Tax=Triparma columacea TaxID=722753 RepID=A0A9W7GLL6_9STRA|nr:hypothetical protein TrCOL_g8902 [Triparma columacea]